MHDWNVIISIHERGFRETIRLLEPFGSINRTDYFNVLVMKTDDIELLKETLWREITESPGILNFISRVVPVTDTFTFQNKEEFESRATGIVLQWVSRLAGKRFHVRMHRRGFKRRLSSMDEERLLDDALLQELEKKGTPGKIDFDNPDAVIAVETVGQRAGISFWTHAELENYPFLGLVEG